MAKADSGAQKMLSEIQNLKEEIAGLKNANETRFGKLEKMCSEIMGSLTEIQDTNSKILTQRPAGSSKSAGVRKTAAQSYVDADGKMKSSSEWFKVIWCNNAEEARTKYLGKKHVDDLNEFMKDPKRTALPADKKLKEQAVHIWNTFVSKTSEKADDALRKKIVEGYTKAKADVESKAKAPAAAPAGDDEVEVDGDEAGEGEEETA